MLVVVDECEGRGGRREIDDELFRQLCNLARVEKQMEGNRLLRKLSILIPSHPLTLTLTLSSLHTTLLT